MKDTPAAITNVSREYPITIDASRLAIDGGSITVDVAGIIMKLILSPGVVPSQSIDPYLIFVQAEGHDSFAKDSADGSTPHLTVTVGELTDIDSEAFAGALAEPEVVFNTEDGLMAFYPLGLSGVRLVMHSPRGRLIGLADIYDDFTNAHVAISGSRSARHYAFNSAVMMAYAFRGLREGVLLFHASCVERGDRAYLFLGKSGTGKSTHAALWLQHVDGANLLNDDNPAVRLADDNTAGVFGTPWSGKTSCYRPVARRLSGIVQLSQATQNHINQLTAIEAYAAIVTSVSVMRWRSDYMQPASRLVSRLATSMDVFHLRARPDREAAMLCHKALEENHHNSISLG